MNNEAEEQHKDQVHISSPDPDDGNLIVGYIEELIDTVQATAGSDEEAVKELKSHVVKLDNERRNLQRQITRLENDKAFYKAKASAEGDVAVEKDRANLRRAASQAIAILDRVMQHTQAAPAPRRTVAGRRVARPATTKSPNMRDELLKVHRLLYLATNSVPPRRITVSAKPGKQ